MPRGRGREGMRWQNALFKIAMKHLMGLGEEEGGGGSAEHFI